MAHYCVSFRIANQTIGGRSYDQRRADMIENLKEQKGYWEETTSFLLVESEASTSALTSRASKALSAQHDLLFVFDPGDMSASYFGAVQHIEVLRSFFPKLKKVG